MKIKLLLDNPSITSVILGIIYLVGLIGLSIPLTQSIFIGLTPITLLLTFLLLVIYHRSENLKRDLIIFIIIFLSGFLIEVIGVKTGDIFGNYRYGNALGLKFLETPLIIGLNWLMLCYVTTSIISRFRLNKVPVVILASLMMFIYDIILEQVAPQLDFWYWENGVVPVQNFVSWFFISVILNSLIQYFSVSTTNKLSISVYLIQSSFFVMIYFVGKLL